MFKQLKTLFAPRATAPAQGLLVNAYSTLAEVAAPAFALQLHGRRDDGDAGMRAGLQEFLHYLHSLGEGRMSSTRYHAMRHIQRSRHQLSFEVAPTDRARLAEWALGANALLVLADGQLRDPQGRVLVSNTDGGAEAGAAVPFPADARLRQAATEAALAARGLHPAATLPPVTGAPELRLRQAGEAGGRALALLAVALRAESLAAGNALPLAELERKLPGLRAVLSPQETVFLEDQQPGAAALAQYTWRHESLLVLAWALGLAALPWPDQPCDAAALARAVLERARDLGAGKPALRPAAEILDALDLHYRLHWLVRQARLDDRAAPPELDAGVVSERHLALNWLTRFEDAAWDDTDTPT